MRSSITYSSRAAPRTTGDVATTMTSHRGSALATLTPTTTAMTTAMTTTTMTTTTTTASARYVWSNTYRNGDRYHGEVVGPQHTKDGTGEYVWSLSGAVYRGAWHADVPHGHGVLTVPGVDGYAYTGAFVHGRRSGQGTCRFASGRVYCGAWRDDEMDGEGTLTGAVAATAATTTTDASSAAAMTTATSSSAAQTTTGIGSAGDVFREYTGPFVCGARHGARGRCVYVNGDVYEGAWQHGKRHGYGVLQLAAAAARASSSSNNNNNGGGSSDVATAAAADVVQYAGLFVNDMPALRHDRANGACRDAGRRSSSSSSDAATAAEDGGAVVVSELRYGDGSSYRGSTDGLLRDGDGEHRLANGDVYTGGFSHDVRSGAGVLRCRDGRCYTGTWCRGQLVGRVTYTYNNSNTSNNDDHDAMATPVLVHYTGPVLGECELTGSDARARYADGSVYAGEVVCGQPAGQGTLERRALPHCFAGADVVEHNDNDDNDDNEHKAGVSFRHCEVLLLRYEGSFYKGQPHGDGTATLQCVCHRGAAVTTTTTATLLSPRDVVVGFCIDYCRDATYTGAWSHGRPHGGHGTWRWHSTTSGDGGGGSEDVYVGGVSGGVAHDGSGRARYSSATVMYEGGFARGQACGHGRLRWRLRPGGGDVYKGAWRDGLAHGQGTLVESRPCCDGSGGGDAVCASSDGDGRCERVCYTGAWRRGKRHGYGVERRLTRQGSAHDIAAGDTTTTAAAVDDDDNALSSLPLYEGEYCDNARHGRGIARDGVDGSVDEGNFVRGVLCGDGVRTLRDGTRIVGCFVDGRAHGVCDVHFAQGVRFRGTLEHGRLVAGQGEMTYANGDRYVGAVEPCSHAEHDGDAGSRAHGRTTSRGGGSGVVVECALMPQRHGEGVYTFAEGNVLACTWRHNVLHGRGVYTTAVSGERSERVYEDGVLLRTSHGGGGVSNSSGVDNSSNSCATSHTTAADLFTAENEFPNTLSADVLRKRMPVIAAAAAAASAARQQQQQQPSTTVTHQHNGSSTRPRRSKTCEQQQPQQQQTRQQPAARATTRASSRATLDATPPQTPPSSQMRPRASLTTATVASRTASQQQQQQPCRRQSSSSNVTTTVAALPQQHNDTSSVSTNAASATRTRNSADAPGKRFERAIGALQRCDNDDASNNSNNNNSSNNSSNNNKMTDGKRSCTATLASATAPRHGPMRGQLRALMDEATTIRSVHEDVIHELTERVRQLNERIWQTRFATCATTPTTPTRRAQLQRLRAERKTTVQQLLRALDVERTTSS